MPVQADESYSATALAVLVGFVRAVPFEWRPLGVRVNAVGGVLSRRGPSLASWITGTTVPIDVRFGIREEGLCFAWASSSVPLT